MTDFRPLRERPLSLRIQTIVSMTGADEDNLTLHCGEQPWEAWQSPVMILAGIGQDGCPCLWLACRDCGWFLGYGSQYDPAALAEAAQKHREAAPAARKAACDGNQLLRPADVRQPMRALLSR